MRFALFDEKSSLVLQVRAIFLSKSVFIFLILFFARKNNYGTVVFWPTWYINDLSYSLTIVAFL